MNKPKVLIAVSGGIAEIMACAPGIEVDLRDFDNNRELEKDDPDYVVDFTQEEIDTVNKGLEAIDANNSVGCRQLHDLLIDRLRTLIKAKLDAIAIPKGEYVEFFKDLNLQPDCKVLGMTPKGDNYTFLLSGGYQDNDGYTIYDDIELATCGMIELMLWALEQLEKQSHSVEMLEEEDE